MTNLDGILKGRDMADKGPSCQSYGFSSSHVWMWKLDHKESWVTKNWYFWTVVLEKTLESPLDCKEIKPVNPKGNHSWIFIGRTHAEAWSSKPSDAITDSLEKTLMLGKTEGRRRRGWQRMKWLDAITDSMGMSLSKLWELVMGMEAWLCCSPRGLGHRVGHVWATELKWTNTTRKSSPEILVTLLMA